MVDENKNKVLVVGANGKVGSLVCLLLERAGFEVTGMDITDKSDKLSDSTNFIKAAAIHNEKATGELLEAVSNSDIVIPMLPAHLILPVAKAAHGSGAHYIDPTEVVETTEAIRALAENGTYMVPQSGLAPGMIGIIGGHLARQFDEGEIENIKLMVGALPQKPEGELKWAATWSVIGMIVECMEECNVVLNGKPTKVPALQGREDIEVAGESLRAAYTSGGLGTITETFKVKGEASYKTLRHEGHWSEMIRLLEEIKTKDHIEELAKRLASRYPPTKDDRVVMYAEVTGKINGVDSTKKFEADFRPIEIDGKTHTAIAWTTASGIVGVAELIKEGRLQKDAGTNFVRQEQINIKDFLNTSAGKLYAEQSKLLQSELKNGREK